MPVVNAKELQAHQLRVLKEKEELDEKRSKLVDFLLTETFKSLPQVERDLLILQESYMRSYSGVLGQRIARF